ncbi:MAG TPA: apolipoprotein N-acyltransferase, partial [Verrucomicrobiae bacterium]
MQQVNDRPVVAERIVRGDRLRGENQQQNAPCQDHPKNSDRVSLEKIHRDKLVEVLPAAKLFRQHYSDMAESNNVPLVVDLDGTLIRTDMVWESLARLLRRNPLALFQILFWWMRGRARLKQNLARRVQIDPATLPYHEPFLVWLREQKNQGRKLVLATASDLKMAEPVAAHIGLFDEVLASDGKTNLRSQNKLRTLTEKFGPRGFDYAGNSSADFAVWRGARQAIVVNASQRVLQEAARCTEVGATFCEGFSPIAIAKRVISELFLRSGYLAAIVAGLVMALAFPKFGLAGFAWVAPAVLFAAARGQAGADAFRTGYVGGFTFWLTSLYWLLLMPVTGLPILGWIALCAYIAVYQGIWVWLISSFNFANSSWSNRLRWSLGGAAAWVALEMVRARLFSGFPWSFLGVSQYQMTPLIQVAAVTGVYGVSFLVAWFGLSLYSASVMIFQQPTRRHIWQMEIVLPMLAVVACYVGGFFSLTGHTTPKNFLRVTAIQPSVPQTLIWSSNEDNRRFRNLLDLSQRALATNESDLLVWPESAVPGVDEPTYRAINQFVQSNHVWLILNADDVEFHPTVTNYFNAAFLIDPDGHWQLPGYHKRRLVIFGEYVPLANWLPFLKWLTPITGGWTSGAKPETFEIKDIPAMEIPSTASATNAVEIQLQPPPRTVKTSPLICFEDTFPNAARDAAQDDVDFLVNLTNDGWFQESAEQRQHMANAVFRAVENHVPLLRCANNGVTCLIDDRGRLQKIFHDAHGSEYGPGALAVNVPLLSPAE